MKHNGIDSAEVPYPRDEIDDPLKEVCGTAVETVEHKEDRVTRQVV